MMVVRYKPLILLNTMTILHIAPDNNGGSDRNDSSMNKLDIPQDIALVASFFSKKSNRLSSDLRVRSPFHAI